MVKLVEYIKFPSPLLVYDDYCDNYEQLERSFPTKSSMIPYTNNESLQYQVSLLSDMKFNDQWKTFIEHHISKKYFESTFYLMEDVFLKWRPKLFEKIKSGNYTYGDSNSNSDVQYNFIFLIDKEIVGKNGMEVHVDDQKKIFQSMVYFKHPDDTCSEGNIHITNLKKDNTMCDVVRCRYIQNRNVILPHTPSGWHFVSSRNSSYDRKMINVVFQVKDELQEIDPKFFEQKL